MKGYHNIATYLNYIKVVYDEIELLDARSICICVDCEGGAEEKNRGLDERKKLVQFLVGLNETYTSCRRNIMMTNPPTDINRAYVLLLQEERQRGIHPMENYPTDSNSFNVSSQGHLKVNPTQANFYNTSTGISTRIRTSEETQLIKHYAVDIARNQVIL